MDIRVKRGLKIPLLGAPITEIKEASLPKTVALDVSNHETLRFQILVKPGIKVVCGTPLLEDKATPGRYFVAPAAGMVKEIIRGEKRRILFISIETDTEQESQIVSKENLIEKLLESGIFASIYQRPCKRLANPHVKPEAIFVKAIESAPFVPSPVLEIQENQEDFTNGLQALKGLTDGPVHIISSEAMPCPEGIETHTATGLHPCGNLSVHIYHIHPIVKPEQVVWTLSAHTVIAIGALLRGERYQSKIISLAGEGVKEEDRAYYRVHEGCSIREIVENRLVNEPSRIISGDPLMGQLTDLNGYLTQDAFTICAIPERVKRGILHFLGLGSKRYTATHTYLSSFLPKKERPFSTSQHGEERAFVDGGYYDRVMPMRIPTMPLVKALMAEDFEKAVSLGLLEVDAEDFALPAFICPSKIPMPQVVRQAQQLYAEQYLS